MFAFLVASALAQDSITCEATDGSHLTYTEWHKSGGAYPAPDTVMASTSWSVGATVLSEQSQTYQTGNTGRRRLDWEWLTDKTVVQSTSGGPMSGVTKYTTEVRVWTLDHTALSASIAASELIVPMRCERVDVCCIP